MPKGVYGEQHVFYMSLKINEPTNTKLVGLASELGVSKSEVVRRAVMKYRPTKKEREAASSE